MASFIYYAVLAVAPVLSKLFKKRCIEGRQHKQTNDIEPLVCHKVLHETEIQGRDIFIVGDVHGCYDEMVALLHLAKQHTSKEMIVIFVGDVVNKGPKSIEVLEYLLQQEFLYCVRGNHDHKILNQYFEKMKGKRAQSACKPWTRDLTERHISFLKSLPYTLSIPCLNLTVVHAGLIPGISLQMQPRNSMLTMKSVVYKKDWFHGKILFGSKKDIQNCHWIHLWHGPQHVYYGHDAAEGLQLHKHSTGLDTGCVYGNNMTAILLHLHHLPSGKSECLKRQIIQLKSNKAYRVSFANKIPV